MNTFNQSVRVGLFFVLGLALVWVVYETLSEATFYKAEGYTVEAAFSDLKQLKLGDDVRLAGVRIGSVTHTRLHQGHAAIAVLNIEHEYSIPADSLAKISTAGLLGSNYIAIAPGLSSQNLKIGDTIATAEVADMSTIIEQIGDISKRIDKFLASIERALSTEGDKQSTISMLLYDPNFAKDLRATVDNFANFSAKLNNDKSTIGRLVTSDDLYQKASDAVNKVQNAISTIEDSGPITAVGVAASVIF